MWNREHWFRISWAAVRGVRNLLMCITCGFVRILLLWTVSHVSSLFVWSSMLRYVNLLCVGCIERQNQKSIKHNIKLTFSSSSCAWHTALLLRACTGITERSRDGQTRDTHIWKVDVTQSRSSAHHTWLWSDYLPVPNGPPPQQHKQEFAPYNVHNVT
jgi:hypothetical protein